MIHAFCILFKFKKLILIQEFQFYKLIPTDSLSKHSCFRDIAEIQAVQDSTSRNPILHSTSPPVPVATSFIHSTLLRAPIGIEFNFYFKEHSVSHTPFVCTHMDQGLKQNQGHSSRTKILRGRSNKLLENKFYCVYRLIQFKLLRTLILRKGDVVISTKKLNIQEFTFFRLAYFTFSQVTMYLSCVKEHTVTIGVNGLFKQTSENCYSAQTAIDKLTLLLNISHAIQAKSNSHLFKYSIDFSCSRDISLYSYSIILCINTGNFFSVFTSLQDVITCTYMTCKNKVNKTPVLRLSSI